jgi:hypothetical protein
MLSKLPEFRIWDVGVESSEWFKGTLPAGLQAYVTGTSGVGFQMDVIGTPETASDEPITFTIPKEAFRGAVIEDIVCPPSPEAKWNIFYANALNVEPKEIAHGTGKSGTIQFTAELS